MNVKHIIKLLFATFTLSQALSHSLFAEVKRPLRLGAVLPLSGDLAHYGVEIRNGIELAREDADDSIELYFEDAPLTGARIISALEVLVARRKIDAIAGNFSNVAMLSMAPRLSALRIPTFHTAASDDDILASSTWIFSTNVRVRDEGSHVASYLRDELGILRAAVFSAEINFGVGYKKAFEERFRWLGGKISSGEEHSITTFDFRAQLTRMLESKPEAIFLGTFGPFLGAAVKQLRELGAQVPLFTVYEAEDPSVVDSAGAKNLEGIRYFVTYSGDDKFEERYQQRYGSRPGTFSRNAYDATTLLVRAIRSCDFDKECVKKELYGINSYSGVSYVISIEPDGAAVKPFILRGFEGGEFRRVSK
jgi:branched-chain amino acid transport system substrate-binding protein